MKDSVSTMASLSKAVGVIDERTGSRRHGGATPPATVHHRSPSQVSIKSVRTEVQNVSPQPSISFFHHSVDSVQPDQLEDKSEKYKIKEAIQIACSILLLHYIVPVSGQSLSATNSLVLDDVKRPTNIFFPDFSTMLYMSWRSLPRK